MIRCGLDCFLDAGKYRTESLGLLSNQTGITSHGEPNWMALIEDGYKLSALFGPEHGITGALQDGLEATDSKIHGIPVYSLYGENHRPKPEHLDGLELFLIDIQDIGCRNYTYLYTAAYCIEECARAGIPVIVLDRPAPLGPEVEGNPIQPQWASFVGDYGLTNRTGLTIGEFATYLQGNYVTDVDLTVVEVDGWRKSDGLFEGCGPAKSTPYPWVSPSPNIPTIATALCYPGMVLFEGTNVSEGRGTTRPFELLGAPWIDADRLRSHLIQYRLPGVTPITISYVPMYSKYAGESCSGLQLLIANPRVFKPLKTAVYVIAALKELHPEEFAWNPSGLIDKLSGGTEFRNSVDSKLEPDEIYRNLTNREQEFRERVASSLLYH